MVKIIDRTLSCLDDYSIDKISLKRLLTLLLQINCDKVELSEKIYQAIKPLPPQENYVLRINNLSNRDRYPEFNEFVCENFHSVEDQSVTTEIKIDHVTEVDKLNHYFQFRKIRVSGLDDAMLHDYETIFKKIRGVTGETIEFCPMNRLKCATAIASEWDVSCNNATIVTSFGALKDCTPLEELMLTLHIHRRLIDKYECQNFLRIKELIESIIHVPFLKHKAIIGSEIFHVESGIHIDGIRKNPYCYEPYDPEFVGQKRQIILGKKSGRASIVLKIKELNLNLDERLLPQILQKVKMLSINKNDKISDAEFRKIVDEVVKMGCVN
ncbi:hypothetical protein NIE88_03620 [Sporolactobacillus shoreicorticis]|uniref:2-isopropylmalate synthase/homocitrate synthase post-catalytic domain-containing protein n=1 Tax=Sporolactobacillus shoreicorticis TaxID=1923877 RepID=A0ABW5S0R8_9BACL|nr:hypothetical protein [Sporolactobacillus shoreicorticis]MCO7124863.1 hypothetical protein [Sporolactobacillus shoreicorticis]